MSEDYKSILLFAVTVGATVSGWFLRELWEAVDRLRSDMAGLAAEMPKEYVRRIDYREDVRELKMMVGEIWQAMKDKQDKP